MPAMKYKFLRAEKIADGEWNAVVNVKVLQCRNASCNRSNER